MDQMLSIFVFVELNIYFAPLGLRSVAGDLLGAVPLAEVLCAYGAVIRVGYVGVNSFLGSFAGGGGDSGWLCRV